MKVLMGPPQPGPMITVKDSGIYLSIRINEPIDLEILQIVLARIERRRYGKLIAVVDEEKE